MLQLHNLFFQPVKSLIKINDTTEKALHRLGIFNIRDLIFYKPISCNQINLAPDLRKVRHGYLIQAEVTLDDVLQPTSRRSPLKILASNDTGSILLVFFNKIHPYIYSRLRVGQKITISGKVELYDGMVQISHPEFIFKKEYSAPIMPVYPLTYGIVGKQLYGYIIDAINLLQKSMIVNNYYGHEEYFEQLILDVKALHYVIPEVIGASDESVIPEVIGASEEPVIPEASGARPLGLSETAIRNPRRDDVHYSRSPEIPDIRLAREVLRTCSPNSGMTASSGLSSLASGMTASSGLSSLASGMTSSFDSSLTSLAFRELFANQALMAKIRAQEHRARGRSFQLGDKIEKTILTKLGFELTDGQREAIEQIKQDQASSFQMMRLLQGDVGSGKTIVALLTMLNVVKYGAQSAFMVPTDLLSNQHYQFFSQLLAGTDVNVGLLTGKASAKQKKQINADLLAGKIDILIGTHALFQEKVEFKDLGYVVIDEQHRFGVEQRLELVGKASNPDVLVMTATPIPRSLLLTSLGDMDVTQVKTKPVNRLPIITTIISTQKRDQVIASLERKLQAGEKIYWICPLVDEKEADVIPEAKRNRRSGSEEPVIPEASGASDEPVIPEASGARPLGLSETAIRNPRRDDVHYSRSPEIPDIRLAREVLRTCSPNSGMTASSGLSSLASGMTDSAPLSNVTVRYAQVSAIYPDQVAMIHGKLKGPLKDQIMQEFKDDNKNILVATTVIEVGIDVPDATLIIIENAEQFGLAQLHQLRGRVGRGPKQSHCVLMYNPKRFSKLARERLQIMRDSNDGFYIAEQDLLLRGGGEILGTKQSGEPEFFFADLVRDLDILLEVNEFVASGNRHCEGAHLCATVAISGGYDENFLDFQIELFRRHKK